MDTKIKKCLKSYLCGKKHMNTDNNTALQYFKQTTKLLHDLKINNMENKYNDILDQTENECDKLLNKTLETTIEEPNIITKKSQPIDIFSCIEKGDIDTIKTYNELDFYKTNAEGLTALHYAIKYGDTKILKYAFRLGIEIDTPELKTGYTLLEYAGVSNDPNLVTFLENNGANVYKHIKFRENKKYFNKLKQIDNSLIIKLVLVNYPPIETDSLSFIFDYIASTEKIGLDNITIKEFVLHLQSFVETIDNTFVNILKEELKFSLSNKLGCPQNKLDIILYYLALFINYPFNLTLRWLINLEIKYNFLKILKTTKPKNIKNVLIETIDNKYIKTNLLSRQTMENILSQWLIKINV